MLVVQNAANPSAVLDEIVGAVPAGCTEFFAASAYLTREGTRLLFDRLRVKMGSVAFAAVPKRLVTTFDYGLTDANGVDDWLAAGADARIANASVVQAGNLTPAAAYHPKLYGFRSPAGAWEVVSGSANLTARGMTINAEAAVGSTVADADMATAIARLSDGAAPADPALLAAYRALKALQPPPPALAPLVAPVPPPQVVVGALDTLWEALAGGVVVPAAFNRFWVQTLAMSGGSGSQLELPRGAHEFFGFVFFNYAAAAKVTIGTPVLMSGPASWSGRILSWHGNNGMERLNMPTPAMSGFYYGNSAVSFRRRANGFEFVVAPWGSSLAASWRAASAAAGRVYKLGGNSPRICGFV